MSLSVESAQDELARRYFREKLFEKLCFAATWIGVVVLAVLLIGTIAKAVGWLDWQFMTSFDSRKPQDAGILAPLLGSLWLTVLTGLFAIPVGVGAAVYLEEYSSDTWLRRVIQTNLANLAGVPSIVYGILGLSVFVRMFGVFGTAQAADSKVIILSLGFTHLRIPLPPLPLGSCLLAGAGTLALLVMPTIIVASQEALRAIPPSIRHASLALGATRWQTVRHQVLPAAFPGILTGVILAMSRAIGEAAPLLMMGALMYVARAPGGIDSVKALFSGDPGFEGLMKAPYDKFTALPLQIYNWISRSEDRFQNVAAAGIVVLLVVLLSMNGVAIYLRQKYRKKLRW
jgi:phosphate transport system permease protein